MPQNMLWMSYAFLLQKIFGKKKKEEKKKCVNFLKRLWHVLVSL